MHRTVICAKSVHAFWCLFCCFLGKCKGMSRVLTLMSELMSLQLL